jgi:hypothetical protein
MIADHRKESAARIPVGRLGTGEEVAAVVVMVAQNAYMTGQTVRVNGGLHYNGGGGQRWPKISPAAACAGRSATA